MRGIVLAGGSGSRLHPLTAAVSKHLLPVYNKPVIYYPLSTLMLAGIREVMVISTPRDLPMIQDLLGSGSQFGLSITYRVQYTPDGIAQALLIAEGWLDGSPCCLILGDNLFYGADLDKELKFWAGTMSAVLGAHIFMIPVSDPERYGVVEFDALGTPLTIVEKPKEPRSSWAVTGLYLYDGEAPKKARTLVPSARGELEITDLNRLYLEDGLLSATRLGPGTAWLDVGTFDSLLEASCFVRTVERRTGIKIGCLEEIHKSQPPGEGRP